MCRGGGLCSPRTSIIAVMLFTAHDAMLRHCQPLRFRTKQCSAVLRYPGDSYVGDEEDGGCEALGQHILDSDLQQEGYQHLMVHQSE